MNVWFLTSSHDLVRKHRLTLKPASLTKLGSCEIYVIKRMIMSPASLQAIHLWTNIKVPIVHCQLWVSFTCENSQQYSSYSATGSWAEPLWSWFDWLKIRRCFMQNLWGSKNNDGLTHDLREIGRKVQQLLPPLPLQPWKVALFFLIRHVVL